MSLTRGGVGPPEGRLRREVLVPMPAYRRLSSLIGLGLVVVLMTSALDAVVWTYRAQRRYWRAEAAESLRQALSRRQAAERAAESVPLADPMVPARDASRIYVDDSAASCGD